MEKEEKGGRKRRKKITFQSIVRRILVGRSIKAGIEGSMKGKLLMKADLPRDLELEVANQIECSLPARRRTSSLKGKLMAQMGAPSTSTMTAPCDESRGANCLSCKSRGATLVSDEKPHHLYFDLYCPKLRNLIWSGNGCQIRAY